MIYALDSDIISYMMKGNKDVKSPPARGAWIEMITNNTKHFENIKELKMDNWKN